MELPETVVATAQNKIPVGSAGVKGVRIGMDGKTPPTTSVVVDLESALAYELTPGAAGKLILTLHTQGGAPSVAKNSPAPAVKAPAPAAKTAVPAVQASAKPVPAPAKVAVVKAPAAKPVVAATKPDPKQVAKAAPAQKVVAGPGSSRGGTGSDCRQGRQGFQASPSPKRRSGR